MKPNNNFQKNSLFISGPNMWNKVPEGIQMPEKIDKFTKNFELFLWSNKCNKTKNVNNWPLGSISVAHSWTTEQIK